MNLPHKILNWYPVSVDAKKCLPAEHWKHYWHILKLIYNYFWLRGSKSAKLKSSVPNESPWLKQAWKEKEIK